MSICAAFILQRRCISHCQLWLNNLYSRQIVCIKFVNFHTKHVPIAVSSTYFINSSSQQSLSKLNLSPLSTDSSRKAQSDSGQKSRREVGSVDAVEDSSVPGSVIEEKSGILKRFREAYRQYGKILVCVHVITSAVWISGFYYAAVSGIDVVALLKWIGASEKIISPFTTPGVGHAAVTYLMYKLASPVRYAVTIGGTHVTVRYLRHLGYLPPIAANQRIRSLVKEKLEDIKERRSKGH